MKAARHHIESLDAFRGLTVAGMILVNNPGNWNAVPSPLEHVAWDGCTFADVVFPCFLFIMGVAIPFAFARRIESGHARRDLYWRIGRRAAILIALGLVLNAAAGWPDLGHLRFPGVLQRIAVVYVIAALITLQAPVGWRAVIGAALLAAHWAVLLLVPFGGHPGGVLLPDSNIAGYIDRTVFGSHMLTATGDPEGLLGTLSSIATALAGTIAGSALRARRTDRERVASVAALGVVTLAAGLAWSTWLPLNKNLWTPSFALVTAGIAALGFSASYAVIDLGRVRGWARPFVWLGVNPLAVYFASEFVGHAMEWPFGAGGQVTTVKTWIVFAVLDPVAAGALSDTGVSLLFAIGYVTIWIAVAGWLYRKEIRVQA